MLGVAFVNGHNHKQHLKNSRKHTGCAFSALHPQNSPAHDFSSWYNRAAVELDCVLIASRAEDKLYCNPIWGTGQWSQSLLARCAPPSQCPPPPRLCWMGTRSPRHLGVRWVSSESCLSLVPITLASPLAVVHGEVFLYGFSNSSDWQRSTERSSQPSLLSAVKCKAPIWSLSGKQGWSLHSL